MLRDARCRWKRAILVSICLCFIPEKNIWKGVSSGSKATRTQRKKGDGFPRPARACFLSSVPERLSLIHIFQGALLQFVNPNTILYGISVFATFIVPFYQSLLHLALFSAFLSAAAFIGTGCWTLFGSFFRGFVNRHFKLVNGILAGLLVYCAVSLVW